MIGIDIQHLKNTIFNQFLFIEQLDFFGKQLVTLFQTVMIPNSQRGTWEYKEVNIFAQISKKQNLDFNCLFNSKLCLFLLLYHVTASQHMPHPKYI